MLFECMQKTIESQKNINLPISVWLYFHDSSRTWLAVRLHTVFPSIFVTSFQSLSTENADWGKNTDALDCGFWYPAGYQIYRKVKKTLKKTIF